ncbi:MYXO-CTERM sorting domain-containing protein [Archangium sp.]|uniref:MYXO-CTERM sorting domain-containing protein n=1 Tax=Archangium sp. TaxID=1872627 RepID=UPI003899C45C
MVPTGSIFERSSRTRRRARARLLALGTVAGLVLLASARAHADWPTRASVTGTPSEVLDVWAPGHFAVGFEQGAYLFLDGGLVLPQTIAGPNSQSAGTYYKLPEACFVSVRQDFTGGRDALNAAGITCGSNLGDPIAGSNMDILRVKHAVGGGAAAIAHAPDNEYAVYTSGTSIYDHATFKPTTLNDPAINGTLGVVRIGDTLYALIGSARNPTTVHRVERALDGTTNSLELFPSSDTPMGAVQAIDLFAAGSPAIPYAVVGTQHGFLQGSIVASSTPLREAQALDGGLGVKSLSMNVGFGGDDGTGFGMAIVAQPDGTGLKVMGAVPMLSDTEAGTVWRDRDFLDGGTAPLKQVACVGASSCVFTADRAGTDNVFIYTNAAGPTLSVAAQADAGVDTSDASVVIDEGTAFTLSLEASDPDGDPVLVTATPWSESSAPFSVVVPSAAASPGESIQVSGATGKICKPQRVGTLVVNASDGLAAHEAHESFPVYVKHTVPPARPSVVFSDGGVLADGAAVGLSAGGAPLTLRTSVADTGCALVENQWTPISLGAGAPSLDQREDAGTNLAVFTPPPFLCQAGGGDSYYRYQVTDEGGLSRSQVLQVHVAPWGSPNPLLSPETGVEHLNAGDSLTLTPASSRHACEGSASFPGVTTEWWVALADGGVPGKGLTYREEPATHGLVLDTEHCPPASSELLITGINRLVGAPVGTSESISTRQVTVQTDREPFDPGAFELGADVLPSDELLVSVVSPLNCKAERNLRADLQFQSSSGGGAPLTTTLAVPGEWRLPLGMGCQGGHIQVKASMVEDTGQRTAETTWDRELPRLEAKLESLPAESVLVARCGEGARATLTQTFPAGACPSSAVSWSQVDGPPLEQTALSGNTVSLTTRDTGLDALVGRSVVVQVTAKAGSSEATIEHTLPITVAPFVKVRRRTEVPAASETGLVGVSVELLNTTACGVSDVSYVEHLKGLTYVEGSAKFDGQPVEASWEEGALTVKGLALAGEGTGTLTYVARPHLVGERRMDGEALLRDVPISLSEAPGVQVPDSGCGCTSSGPGPLVFALGVLGAAVRRRRRQ